MFGLHEALEMRKREIYSTYRSGKQLVICHLWALLCLLKAEFVVFVRQPQLSGGRLCARRAEGGQGTEERAHGCGCERLIVFFDL